MTDGRPTLKSMPMVVMKEEEKESSEYRRRILLLPTAERTGSTASEMCVWGIMQNAQKRNE